MYHDYDLKKVIDHIKTTPKKKFILDTDTANEIDDQFAVTYAMVLDDIDLLALNAAPFVNDDSETPAEGMEKSYEELLRLRGHIDPENKRGIPCSRGSTKKMDNVISPVRSEAAENIVRLVKEADDIVYVGVIGCYTNVASALLLDPTIADKMVLILIGAGKLDYHCGDTNIFGDVNAARVIFECGVPVILIPVMYACTELIYTTNAELNYYLKDKAGAIGNYLCEIYDRSEKINTDSDCCISRMRNLVDLGCISFLHDPSIFSYRYIPSRSTSADYYWFELNDGRSMIYADELKRNRIMTEFFESVRRYTNK